MTCCCSLESSDSNMPLEVEGPASDSGELGVRLGLWGSWEAGTGESEGEAATCSGEELVVVPGGEAAAAERLLCSSALLSPLRLDFRILRR